MTPEIPTIGAIRDTYDPRTYQFAPRGAFDWSKGFDIEAVLGRKLTVKDQGGNYSCGGQAWAYYGAVLEALATKTYEERSARWVYAPVRAPGGGSMGKELSSFVVKNGFALEKDAPSYVKGKPMTEAQISQIPILATSESKGVTEDSRALSYVQVRANIDTIAQAIADNNGCCIALYGADNGTWRSAFPFPPAKDGWEWAHWVYCGKVKMINGKKYIGFINSWGKRTGEDGWQWIGEDYFQHGNVWYGWTLAWDYKPAMIKSLLIQAVKLAEQLLALKTKSK